MKFKLNITELSHDELVHFLSTASYQMDTNVMLDADDEVYYNTQGDTFEDKLATILESGGHIYVDDMNSNEWDDLTKENFKKKAYKGQHGEVSLKTYESWFNGKPYDVIRYPLTLKNIYDGIRKNPKTLKYVTEMFVDESGDSYTAYTLLQHIVFGDEIYG